jgi:hypothetical protein
VVTGFTRVSTSDDVLLVRFDQAGKPDHAFGAGGAVTWNGPGSGMEYGQGIALQTDGRIVVTGFVSNGVNDDLLVARLMPWSGGRDVALPGKLDPNWFINLKHGHNFIQDWLKNYKEVVNDGYLIN